MGEPVRQRLKVEEFYAWLAGQEAKHELIDGQPVIIAGANRRHDRIVANALRILGTQLRGKPCQPFTSDTFIRIPAGNRRLPDLGIDCGKMDDESLEASEPRLVVEVLSPSNRIFDRTEKLEEYKTVATLDYVLLVDPDIAQVRLHQRDGRGAWVSERLTGLEAAVRVDRLDLIIALAELYEGLSFLPRPILVSPATRAFS